MGLLEITPASFGRPHSRRADGNMSKWAGRRRGLLAMERQRVSMTGTSNVRPLNVTRSDASPKIRVSPSSNARSPAGPFRRTVEL